MKHVKYCLLLGLGLIVLTGCNPGSCRGSDPLVGRTRLEPPQTERRPVYVQNRGYGECGVVAGQPMGIPKAPNRCGTCPAACPAPPACPSSCNTCNSGTPTPRTYSPASAQTVSRENGGWLPVTPAREENATVRGQEPHTIIATEESPTTHVTRYPNEEESTQKTEKKLHWVTPQTPAASNSAPTVSAGTPTRRSYQSDFSYENIVPGAQPQATTGKRTFFTDTFAPKTELPASRIPATNTRYDQEKAALAATFEERYTPVPIRSKDAGGTSCTACGTATPPQAVASTGWTVSAPEAQPVQPHAAIGSEAKTPEEKAPVPPTSPSIVETEPGVLDFLSLPE